MPSVYLEPSDYATYGLSTGATTDIQVLEASAIIDGFLNKPEGLIYTVDGDNNPVAMNNSGLPILKTQVSNLRSLIKLSYTPSVALISVQYNISGCLPPTFSIATGSVLLEDGSLYLSTQICSYTLVMINYVAGYLYSNLPPAIKQACASIVEILQEGIISGAVSKIKAGGSEIDYNITDKDDSIYIDASVASMLRPYKRVFA